MNRPAIHVFTTDGLESRLREEVSALVASGLAEDEAFMVAVKRVGDLDAASHQLAREQTDRLWRRLDPSPGQIARPGSIRDIETYIVVFVLAAVVALAIKLPEWWVTLLTTTWIFTPVTSASSLCHSSPPALPGTVR